MSTTAFTITDLYCGAGGSTTGAAAVPGVEVHRAINHWERAVDTMEANHPTANPIRCDLLDIHPACFERSVMLLASPECRKHGPGAGMKRKGIQQGEIFEADRCDLSPDTLRSRATMWTPVHWASVHRHDFVIVENVVEIHYWPEFEAWLREWDRMGYDHARVYVNGMFVHGLTDDRVSFSMPQSRDRIYVVFWRKGNPAPNLRICPLAPCHGCAGEVRAVQAWKNGRAFGKYRRQYVYRCPHCATVVEPWYYPAATAIDWTRRGIRIGDREAHGLKPLVPNTIARINYGLERVGLREHAVMTRAGSQFVYANRTNGTLRGLHEGMHTVTTGTTLGLLTACRTNGRAEPADVAPMGAVTAGGTHHGLVTGAQVTLRGTRSLDSFDAPMGTACATAIQTGVLTREPFVVSYYGTDQAAHVADPLGTVTTKERHALVDGSPAESIEDLYFRMLDVPELLVGTGYAPDYKLVGTKGDRVRLIGGSNYSGIEQLLVQRCVDTLG